jgi:starvation-inducible outer membrane lipoprotein
MPKLALLVAMMLVLAGCVTINVYFPAAAAEKAADKIIDEVWQLKQGQQGQKPAPAPAPAPSAPKQ